MSGDLQRFARRLWSGAYGVAGRGLLVLLTPLAWMWRFATALRNRRATARPATRLPGLTVVSVGNLAVGGTGKTPITSWVAREASRLGGTPAILLSGYGGDEERLHGIWAPSVSVFADRDRTLAAERAVADGANVAVLDDGFQHRRLGRDLDIVLVSVEDPWPMRSLPTGPYRETGAALSRADAIVLTRRGDSSLADAERVRVQLSALSDGVSEKVLASVHLAPGPLHALTGNRAARARLESAYVVTAIARPDAFVEDVSALADIVTGVSAFGDHHPFSRADAVRVRARAGTAPIVMTEKDAVKLRSFARELDDAWVLTQRLHWDWGEAEVRGALSELAWTNEAPAQEVEG